MSTRGSTVHDLHSTIFDLRRPQGTPEIVLKDETTLHARAPDMYEVP